jgi:anthranilate phosphoribosyltransferase
VPATTTWPDLLTTLLRGTDLDADRARWAMTEIMGGEASPVQVAGFLTALRAKGESVTELRALADVMLEHAHRIEVTGPSIDVVGTGGDRLHTVNISTMSAVVVAGTGLRVVKHGNRAASSSSGSADVLESLGVSLTLSPEQVAEVAERAGITFCFAQTFHPAMRHAAAARSGLGVPTVFNVLGPMTNPAQPTYAAVGVADPRMAPLIAGVFADRGKDAAVFRGDDGLDEVTIASSTTLWWVRGGEVTEVTLVPEDLGVSRRSLDQIRGADAAFNAAVATRLLDGEVSAVRDAVLLNAGVALAVAAGDEGPGTDGVSDAVRRGMAAAAGAIDSGAARQALARWIAATRSVAG